MNALGIGRDSASAEAVACKDVTAVAAATSTAGPKVEVAVVAQDTVDNGQSSSRNRTTILSGDGNDMFSFLFFCFPIVRMRRKQCLNSKAVSSSSIFFFTFDDANDDLAYADSGDR